MKTGLLSVIAIAAIASVPAAAAQRGAPAAGAVVSTDKPLDKQIEKQLAADPLLKHADVHVSVAGNVATLTGTVATDRARTRAGRLAKMGGITRVDNQIVVDPHAGVKGTAGQIEDKTKEGAEKTAEEAKKAGEKTKEGAEKVWDKTKEGATKVGDETSDAYILSRVKSRFVGVDVLKGSDINVDCDNRVVTLKGTVSSEAARTRAIDIAKRTEGVREVVDRLTLAQKH
jgi:hyperosmotically inducible protein